MHSIPDIKLIRTDTTLDLSQKAEKRYWTSGNTFVSILEQNEALCFTANAIQRDGW